jgi:hypothetical protein
MMRQNRVVRESRRTRKGDEAEVSFSKALAAIFF